MCMSLAYKPLMFVLMLLVGLGASPPLLPTVIYECYHTATYERTPFPRSHVKAWAVTLRSGPS